MKEYYTLFGGMFLSFLSNLVTITKDTDASSVDISNTSTCLHAPFQLPIAYLPSDKVHALSDNIVQDLELVVSPTMSMYETLFQPSHAFGRDLIPEWSKWFSTDIQYLSDTQNVILNMPKHTDVVAKRTHDIPSFTKDTCTTLTECWQGLNQPDFLEKYNFIEWNMFKYLNDSSLFLELLSLGSILSPLVSLVVPILFLVLPFVILKIQGAPIDFQGYLGVLKHVAKNHFIGKAIMGIQSMSVDKLIYVGLMFMLYLMQVYQNVVLCARFYQNTRQMNQDLIQLRDFCHHSIVSMNVFVEQSRNLPSYQTFCGIVLDKCAVLGIIYKELLSITPFRIGMEKAGGLGYMLKQYYTLHDNQEFRTAIQYAVGFEGYMDNLRGVSKHLLAGRVALISTDSSSDSITQGSITHFRKQYYPALLASTSGKVVRNDVVLDKNMIITGPNASGKTTFLKTTAINIIFTQQVGCGFYHKGSCLPKPYTHIHSYLNIPDTSERDSLFQAEARRCKDIIDIVEHGGENAHHFSIFDELYSGTNPKEATKAAYAFLNYLSQRPNVDFILTTHYVDVCRKFKKKSKHVRNYKMMVVQNKDTRTMKYTYRIKGGISKIEGAGHILEEMNYPKEIMGTFHATA